MTKHYQHIEYYSDKVKWFNFVRFNYSYQARDEHILVSNTNIFEFLEKLNHRETDQTIGIISRVCTPYGEEKHIPILDLSIYPNQENAHFVKSTFEHEGISGFLLNSGNSFHFYGKDLLYEDEWLRFMYKSLLIPTVTDTRHVGHRLLDGYGTLRLTTNAHKPKIPELILEW